MATIVVIANIILLSDKRVFMCVFFWKY